jgi:hypothetical protein
MIDRDNLAVVAKHIVVAAGFLVASSACVLTVNGDDAADVDASVGGPDAPGGGVDASPGGPDAAVIPPDAATPGPDPLMGNLLTYTFDNPVGDQAFDRFASDHDGDRNGATTTVDGRYGRGLDIAGGFVYVAREPRLTHAPLTIEAWVQRTAVADIDTIFSDKVDVETPSASVHLAMLPNAEGVRFQTNVGCGGVDVIVNSTATVVGAGVWHHVAVTWDGAEIGFYLDGAPTETQALAVTPCADGAPFRVGEEADGGGNLNGQIDEVKISDYAKSQSQIAVSMAYDTAAFTPRCGDHVVEGAEQCDIDAACCDFATCTFRANGTACGAGGCVDGVCADPTGRAEDGLVALWGFGDGAGATVADLSGIPPTLNLTIADPANVTWNTGSLTVDVGTIISSVGPATKIIQACQASNELTIEAWIEPANLTQGGPARVATLSVDTGNRNFTLGQQADNWVGRTLTSLSNENGQPQVWARPGDATLALTHLVVVRKANGQRVLYVDGIPRATNRLGVDFSTWDASYVFALANELTLDRVWLGTLHGVAVYDRALTSVEVGRNFTAGVF